MPPIREDEEYEEYQSPKALQAFLIGLVVTGILVCIGFASYLNGVRHRPNEDGKKENQQALEQAREVVKYLEGQNE